MATLTELFGMGVDEAGFAFILSLVKLHKTPQFTTSRAELEQLRHQANYTAQQLFPAPALPKVQHRSVPRSWELLPQGRRYQVSQLTFPSAFPLGYPNNDTVHAYHLCLPGRETGPTLIYLHGWMAAASKLWLRPPLALAAPLDCNILFIEQSFHMHRTPPGSSSGHLILTGDLMMALKSVQQSVSDVRAGLAWLRSQGVEKVALVGRSMGGLVAATTLTAESGFDCAVLEVPAISPHSSIWHSNYTRLVRKELRQQGLDEAGTARYFEVVRPGRFRPALDPQRILLIEATGDRVCAPCETERFAQEWGIPTVQIGFGHMSAILSRKAKRAVLEFLKRYLNNSK